MAVGGGNGAGNGARTHDLLLGKQPLYLLSYTRMWPCYPALAVDVNLNPRTGVMAGIRRVDDGQVAAAPG